MRSRSACSSCGSALPRASSVARAGLQRARPAPAISSLQRVRARASSRRGSAALLFAQALLALRELVEHARGMLELRVLDLQRLLGSARAPRCSSSRRLRARAERLLRDGQLFASRRRARPRRAASRSLRLRRSARASARGCAVRRASCASPRCELRAQVRDLVLDARAVLAHVRDLLLEPRDFGVGFVERALRGVHRVAGPVVLVAQRFEPLLGFAQLRGLGFELDAEPLDLARVAGARGRRFLPAREPQQALGRVELALQLVVALRDFGLRRAGARAACRAPGGCRPRAAGSRACP